MKQTQLLCYRCTVNETKQAGRIVQGSGPGLQGDLSRLASTQRLTTISDGGGHFIPLNWWEITRGGCDITTGNT